MEEQLEEALRREHTPSQSPTSNPLLSMLPVEDSDSLRSMGPLNKTMVFLNRDSYGSDEAERSDKESERGAHAGVEILHRLRSKLLGQEFGGELSAVNYRGYESPPSDMSFPLSKSHDKKRRRSARSMPPKAQVARLIDEATDIVNVSQSWSGWYPFW